MPEILLESRENVGTRKWDWTIDLCRCCSHESNHIGCNDIRYCRTIYS